MEKKYTKDELIKYDKETIISLFMSMQQLVENLSLTCAEQKAQLEQVNQNMNLILEQLNIAKHKQFGRSSEKMVYDGQLEMCFNEAEVTIVDKFVVEPELEEVYPKPYKRKKSKGKREEDLKDLPVIVINHELSEEELKEHLGDTWKRLPDEVYKRLVFRPAKFEVEEHHVAVYAGKDNQTIIRGRRPAGSKSYMWVYRTGKMYNAAPIVLYKYQKTRNTSHPREFLKDYHGIVVTDSYQVYHTLEKEREDLKIAGCWSHARRRFADVVKSLGEEKAKGTLAYDALKQIAAIYKAEGLLSRLSPEERQKQRQLTVKPLVEAFFVWVKKHQNDVLPKSETGKGFIYCLNHEKYLKVFLEDGNVPADNNAAEGSIRGFCIGKHNWHLIDTINGAKASAIIYSIAETVKANNLKPYNYFELLLTEIPKHMEDTNLNFLDDLLPWSEKLPAECKK